MVSRFIYKRRRGSGMGGFGEDDERQVLVIQVMCLLGSGGESHAWCVYFPGSEGNYMECMVLCSRDGVQVWGKAGAGFWKAGKLEVKDGVKIKRHTFQWRGYPRKKTGNPGRSQGFLCSISRVTRKPKRPSVNHHLITNGPTKTSGIT